MTATCARLAATCRLTGAGPASCRRPSAVAPLRAAPLACSSMRTRTVTTALLNTSVALAVSQQELMFGLVMGAECAFQLANSPPGTKGRPEVTPTAAIAGALLVSFILANYGGEGLAPVGLAIAAVACAAALALFALRVPATEDDPLEWPGPKAWPLSGSVVSVLALLAAVEGLRDIGSP